MEIAIEPMTLSDMAAVLAELDRFWSVAFRRRLGLDVRQVEDYGGPGIPMMVMTRPLPWMSATASPAPS